MKLGLSFAAALVFAASAAAAAVDYTAICKSPKLIASDRHECRVQMTAADADEARQAEIHRAYSAKIESLRYSRAAPAASSAPRAVPSDGR